MKDAQYKLSLLHTSRHSAKVASVHVETLSVKENGNNDLTNIIIKKKKTGNLPGNPKRSRTHLIIAVVHLLLDLRYCIVASNFVCIQSDTCSLGPRYPSIPSRLRLNIFPECSWIGHRCDSVVCWTLTTLRCSSLLPCPDLNFQ